MVRSSRELILEKLPLLALVAASSVATLFAQKTALQPLSHLSILARAGNGLISVVAYMGQMFWPVDLTVYYPFPLQIVIFPSVLLSLVLLVCVTAAVFFLGRSRGYLVTGWLWYLIMLGPVIGILQVGNQARADRYTYLPQIGLFLLLTWTVADLTARWRHGRIFLGVVCVAVLTALAWTAHTQTAYWQNNLSLWAHALASTSNNVVAEQNLAQAVYERGRRDEAMVHFENALRIDPKLASVHSSFGVVLLEVGRVRESLAHLQTAIQLDPNDADAHYNLGNTYLQTARMKEAVAQYNRALEINPIDTEVRNNLAWVLATCPDAEVRDGIRAVEIAERADSLTSNKNPVISATLAAAYAEAGRFDDAVKAAERALQLALNESNPSRAESIRAQMELYRSGRAFRDRRYTPTTFR